MSFTDLDFMRQAIVVGRRGRCTAPPNPWVGCIVVRDGQVVGRGYHVQPGDPHAERMALADAEEKARGSTAYVTLEPCSHTGRTPPCADGLIEAGVSRVIVGVEDPDPRVAGTGIDRLRAAGIEVLVGIAGDEVEVDLTPYLYHRRTGLPWTVIKTATSADGRTAAADGTSRWITTEAARRDVHRLRAESQAVMVGAGTALADRPALTVRMVDCERQPLRVLVDSQGRVPAEGPLFDISLAPTLVLTTGACPNEHRQQWLNTGAEVVSIGDGAHVDLKQALYLLGERGILQLMVEGGAGLHGALLSQGLAQQLSLYLGPKLLGADGLAAFPYPRPTTLEEAPELELFQVQKLDQSVRVDYLLPTLTTSPLR